MITQKLNQRMESVSDDTASNSYSYTDKPGAANDKQYKISAIFQYDADEILFGRVSNFLCLGQA